MNKRILVTSLACAVAMGFLPSFTTFAQSNEGPATQQDSPGVRASTPAGDFTGTDACSVKFNGYEIKGEARLRMVKTGQNVVATVTGYRITGASAGRSKANVDSDMRVWNNAAGSGEGTYFGVTRSADAMLQDGAWHDLNQAMGKSAGFDVKRAHVGVRFTFDMAGGDPTCWADRFDVTF